MSDFEIIKNVYFVRHGQSVDNVSPVFQSPESPLSERGIEQANMIALRASKLEFELLISSPYVRAKQTAEVIREKTGKEIQYSELFVERIKPTFVNGKPYTDLVAAKMAKEWGESLFDPSRKVEDGENYTEVTLRAKNALAMLTETAEKNILVVTHGFFLRAVVASVILGDALSPTSFKNFQSTASMKNTGLSVLQYVSHKGGPLHWRLWVYNDHSHLG